MWSEILDILTSAQVVETSVTITDNSPSQDYTHPEYTITCLPRVQTIYCTKSPVILSRRSAAASFLCIFVPRDYSSNVPRTKTIDSRILKFDNLIITNIRASRFHTSLQGPFAGEKKMIVSSRQLPDHEFDRCKRQNTDAEKKLKARKDWLCEGKVKGHWGFVKRINGA